MKRLKNLCIILFIAVIIGGILLVKVYEDDSIKNTPNYTIYIYENGAATIHVDNIGFVNQEDDGTLTIQGGGAPGDYQYPRRDTIGGSSE